MRRPWQIWTLFLLGVALVAAPMTWLTLKALEVDRKELEARQQIDIEQRVSRALWRMDALLIPLLAQEAARPAVVYCPTVTTIEEGKGKPISRESASPLLIFPPEYVLVHFEVAADGSLSSPQCPPGKDAVWAAANGIADGRMDAARQRLDQLAASLRRDELLAMLPMDSLPPLEVAGIPWNNSENNTNRSQIVANTFDQTQLYNLATANGPPGPSQVQSTPAQPPPPEPPQTPLVEQQAEHAQQPAGQQSARYGNNPRLQRADNDLQSRGQAYQAVAQRAYQEQRLNFGNLDRPPSTTLEGVSQPLWIGDRLILGRRVKSGAQTLVQGCWLDWDKLQSRLRDEVADLDLPEIHFVPLTNIALADQNHLLATLPVQLAVGIPAVQPAWNSPISISLLVAWTCLLLAALFAAMTLQGVMALSERRGAFVAAVTHELRTPLTTFRMYAEMLAEGMVPSAQQRQKYLDTLRREADRLSHLVENVLQYARLERGSSGRRKESLSIGALLERIAPRLADRAEQAEMKLVLEIDDAACETTLTTDGGAVEQILFNLVDNACKYAVTAADKRIHVRLSLAPKRVLLRVCDHGPGVAPDARRKLFRPFSKSVHEAARTAPGVGLGLALSKRLARDLGGSLTLQPAGSDCSGAVFVLALPTD